MLPPPIRGGGVEGACGMYIGWVDFLLFILYRTLILQTIFAKNRQYEMINMEKDVKIVNPLYCTVLKVCWVDTHL